MSISTLRVRFPYFPLNYFAERDIMKIQYMMWVSLNSFMVYYGLAVVESNWRAAVAVTMVMCSNTILGYLYGLQNFDKV